MIQSSIPTTAQPLDIVGGTNFGRYPKISNEQTFNMLISDGWLVPFSGYVLALIISSIGVGRGFYLSTRYGYAIVVINNIAYAISTNLTTRVIGVLNTYTGDVYIVDNNNTQIAICDQATIWIYDWMSGAFTQATTDGSTPLDFRPGYITYQDGYFVAPNISQSSEEATWRISALGDGTQWPNDSAHVGAMVTKGDRPVATLRMPGGGNLLLVFGKTVVEPWYLASGNTFPYQKLTSSNIDFGCVSASTIDSNDKTVVWLAQNEKSGPVLMMTDGVNAKPLSANQEGINFKLSQLNRPEKSIGFFFKQDGHLIYIISFYDPRDNLSLAFDFQTGLFSTLTDEKMNFYIAKRVIYFNNKYYFISLRDGNIYELGSEFTTYNYGVSNDEVTDYEFEIPRVRVCKTFRLPDTSRFVVNTITIPIEQGTDPHNHNPYFGTPTLETPDYLPRVDLAISDDGGETYSSFQGESMNPVGHYRNQMQWWGLGSMNEFTAQFRFYGKGRFVVSNGVFNFYQ